MKNVLVDFYAHKNLGDDLFIKALLERYPNVNFNIISSKRNATPFSKYHNVNSFHPSGDNLFTRIIIKTLPKNSALAKKILKFLWMDFYNKMARKSDVYINIGGSIFIETEKPNLHHELYEYKVKRLGNMPKFILSANFGPYHNNEFKSKYGHIFCKFDDVCFRDQESYELFSNLKQVRYQYDLILNNLPEINVGKINNTVGISIIDLKNRPDLRKYTEKYDQYIDDIVSSSLASNKSVTLISFCSNEGDLAKAKEIKSRHDNVKIIDYQSDVDGFLSTYATLSEVYATRFHAIILALVYKSKLMPISYSKKTTNMLNTIDYTGKVTDIIKNDWYLDANPEFDMALKKEMCNQFKRLDLILNENCKRTQ